ncbi:aldehyde dehydrogenase family protein [Phytomonospora endophytica]|uniref:Acyl-CoA reductase-like NAD-dependent aldehyde dehydrogenase n=1 Tax=Phytomonospora endophytica TaxID=714109 RepID=A0A841FT82_9ACTN|nr:aldehyde dehydrogenase family protein [Phytomonospora endophytica]MBB6039246.1 acyl-CoA reductase-like NAD-dependent aldehyde dehydrogenase [Phytomonospora endophytica]GIG67517.1 aldehyde dehydrogenase [Phytomonospora endophytica]
MVGTVELARARDVAAWWWRIGFDARRDALLRWAAILGRRSPEIGAVMRAEGGKADADATIELIVAVEHLRWAARHARRVLRRRRVRGTWLAPEQRPELDWLPYGVVGVIGPWNFPVLTPLASIGSALAAGNAVLFKPSEHAGEVGRLLTETATEAMRGAPLVQFVDGGPEAGAALVTSGVDKVAFTGSTATAAKVLAAAAPTLTPVLAECGGKDPAIVAAGADVEHAAASVLWGAMFNAGQACVGIERAYVVDEVYDDFVRAIVAKAEGLTAARNGELGAITVPAQLDVITRHIADAVGRGARVLTGGLEAITPPYVPPTILVDVPDDALVVTEETFGPVLPILRAADLDDAVARAESGPYRLGAAVYGGRAARAAAARLTSGMVSVDSSLGFAGQPCLPFGGRGGSGFGRTHGEAGLREFAVPRATVVRRFRQPFDLTTYQRGRFALPLAEWVLRRVYGRGGTLGFARVSRTAGPVRVEGEGSAHLEEPCRST